MSINARKKGHAFELEVVKWMKEAGYEEAMTTRLGSKMLDDQKQDIMNTGNLIIQCKAVESLNVHKAYNEMPDKKGMFNILFHKKNRQGTLVTMSKDDWLEWLGMLLQNDILKK